MLELTEVQKRLIAEVADLHKVPMGAYNFRANGGLAGRNTTGLKQSHRPKNTIGEKQRNA